MRTYRTSDIYAVSYIWAGGARLAGSTGHLKKTFVLESPDLDLDVLAADFYNNGEVKIQDFLNCLRRVRTICKSEVPQ